MNDTLKKIQEYILYHEQGGKISSSSISPSNFEDLDKLLDELQEDDKSVLIEFCEQQFQKNKNHMFSPYILGLLALETSTLNDEKIIYLLEQFADSHKWSVVEYIANRVLKFRNNLQALRYLSKVYEVSNNNNALVSVWEQIVRIDYEEADMLLKLAYHKLSLNQTDIALKDFKKAIQRYLHQKNFVKIREIWLILIEHTPLDTDFYFSFIGRVERILTTNPTMRCQELLKLLFDKLHKSSNSDIEITVLKALLRLDLENEEYREALIEAYREKYASNPKLEDFIRMSNLSQNWRNIHEAISDFEKHISFFPGSFVFHNKWGIGCINETTHQYLVIDFPKKRAHQMEISMAVNSLETLPKSHFWVLKAISSKEKLKEQISKKPIWALKKIITSLDGADLKTIRAELVPSIFTPSEWNTWSVKARKILQDNPYFSVNAEKSDYYVFLDKPVTSIEKFHGTFRQEDSFLNKIKLTRKVLQANTFMDSNVNEDMFLFTLDYFNSHVNAINSPDEYDEKFINALFVCDEIGKIIPASIYHIHVHLNDFISNMSIDTAKFVIKSLKINDYKDIFLTYVKEYRKDWKEIYLQVIPIYHKDYIIEALEKENEQELLTKIFLYIQSNISNYKAGHVWFVTTQHEKDWVQSVSSDFKLVAEMIRTATLVYRDILNKYQVPANKRLFTTIENFLFKSTRLETLILNESYENVIYLYSLLKQISDYIPNRIMEIRESISHAHPTFDFKDQFEFEQTGSTGFLTLSESYEERKKILQRIHEIEVPENSKEIETARAFGDLKENAEYKAAIEHQESLNNKVAQLKKEIEQARIFDKKNLSSANVGFATKIELFDLGENISKTYTILGPWESNPDSNVISYLSPLGQHLYKKKKDEQIEFIINDKTYKMRISNIEIASEYVN